MPEESIEKGSEFSDDELQLLKKTSDATSNIRKELGKVIVGQDKVIDQLLIDQGIQTLLRNSEILIDHNPDPGKKLRNRVFETLDFLMLIS